MNNRPLSPLYGDPENLLLVPTILCCLKHLRDLEVDHEDGLPYLHGYLYNLTHVYKSCDVLGMLSVQLMCGDAVI